MMYTYFTALNQSSLEVNHIGSVFTRVAWAVIKESPDIIWVVCYKLADVIFSPTNKQKTLFVSWQFFETYGGSC